MIHRRLWHSESIAAGLKTWPRRVHPAIFADADPAALGWGGVAASLAPHIERRAFETRWTGVGIGVLFRNPGGLTPAPTPTDPDHADYPCHPWRDARRAGMDKLGNARAFEAAARSLLTAGADTIGVYIGRPDRYPDAELLGMIRRGSVRLVIHDGTAHMAALPDREPVLAAYEDAGARVGFESIPHYDGPGADLRHYPARIVCARLQDWRWVQDRERGQAPHPDRNPPACWWPRALILDDGDEPTAAKAEFAAGRDVAFNFRAAAYAGVSAAWFAEPATAAPAGGAATGGGDDGDAA